jgi:dihydrofolate reductase
VIELSKLIKEEKFMREIVLFIAASLDGYIADASGKVDWLEGQEEQTEMPDVYGEFIKEVDTVIMGWNTYHQIVTELSPDEWVYKGLTSYVITHRTVCSTEEIRFTDENPRELVRRLQKENGKSIWICGGANLIGQLIQENLIDRYYITVIPILLGRGIRLFPSGKQEIKLRLESVQNYNGITDLVYCRR